MTNNLPIPTIVGLTVAAGSFCFAIYGFVSKDFTWQGYQIVWLSLIVGPTAMVSTMLGYAAWWLSEFLVALFSSQDTVASEETKRDPND